jgi:predicted phosphodiesterase
MTKNRRSPLERGLDYLQQNRDGISFKTIAAQEENTTRNAVAGLVKRAREWMKVNPDYKLGDPLPASAVRGAKIIQLPTSEEADKLLAHERAYVELLERKVIEQATRLEVLESDRGGLKAPPNDYLRLINLIAGLRGIVRVLLVADMHLPFHNPQALALAYRIAALAKPRFCHMNGDVFDFGPISRWPQSWRGGQRDVLGEVTRPYDDMVTSFLDAHQMIMVEMEGNHDHRFDVALAAFPQLAETLMRDYAAICRSQGRVLWLDQIQEVNYAHLYVTHGEKTGENAAKNGLKSIGWSNSYVQSHTHQPSLYYLSQKLPGENRRRLIQAATTPSLCMPAPEYMPQSKMARFVNGVMIADVDFDSDTLNLQPVIFHPRADGSLWTVYGEHVLTEPAPKTYFDMHFKTKDEPKEKAS